MQVKDTWLCNKYSISIVWINIQRINALNIDQDFAVKSEIEQCSINGNSLKDVGNKYSNATKPIQDDIPHFFVVVDGIN